MFWLFLAIISYFLNALVVVVDKIILSKEVKSPLQYSFYGGALGVAALLLWIFDFSFLSLPIMACALLAGICFFFAIYFMYSAMNKGEASRVISVIGAVSPLVVLALSYAFLEERLPALWLTAFFVLVFGGLLLTLEKDKSSSRMRFIKNIPFYSLISGIFWALTFFLTKVVFLSATFLNGFVWIRVGTLLIILAIFLVPSLRRSVLKSSLVASKKVSFSFLSNKVASGVAFIVLNISIKIGSVSLINALQGMQYAFVFLAALLIYFYFPKFLQESFSKIDVFQKLSGIAFVSAGLAILFLF